MKAFVKVDYRHDVVPALGILLTNLGTPAAPTSSALRQYLGEFLWDPRVVEIPRPLWWLILHGIILRTRPSKSAAAYQKVWMPGGSPLLVLSRQQRQAIETEMATRSKAPVKVVLGMRYGEPSIAQALTELQQAGCERVLVCPLYPQYSAATTASTFDAVAATFRRWRRVPEMRMITQYHDDDGYITALARSVREYWDQNGRGEFLLMSFHGMPRRTLLAGDPYHCQCLKTARLVAERLGLAQNEWRVVFQSRFGREEWLQPYAAETLKSLPGEGIKKIDVICPGFAADCLETLEEMVMQNSELFMHHGGEAYRYIPALNDRPDHIIALTDLIVRHCQGWPEVDPGWNREVAQREALRTQQRAQAKGAGK
jgi:ferrochelatase